MNKKPTVDLNDVHQDLKDFKETRKTVNELLKVKRALIDQEDSDLQKINEIKGKAMDAIDHLFSEDTH